MIHNTTKAKLAAGGTVHGCFVKYADASFAEYVAMQGWDFLLFEAEHGTLQPADVEDLCRAAELRGVTPITRVTTNEPHVILRYMDAGCHGAQVPWVNTVEGVEQAVQSVKYWPLGIRGLAGTRAADWGLTEPLADYVARANRETMVIVHVETAEAAAAIESFIAVDGVDVLFLGPTDLSHSLGHPGDPGHPDVQAAMQKVVDAVVPSDKVLGVYVGDEAEAAQWMAKGARYLATGAERFLRRGMQSYLSTLREES